MLSLFFEAAGQVAIVALLLGAGLPALFALGVRSFARARTASGPASTDTIDGGSGSRVLPQPVLRTLGVLCFALVVASVAIGLAVIIATGFGQELSFEHIIPTFVPKD